MRFVDDDAFRLAAYLDAHAKDRTAKPDGLDPELVALIEQVTTLNARSTPDSTLKPLIWRTVMNAFPSQALSDRFLPTSATPRRLPSWATAGKAPIRRHRVSFSAIAVMTLALLCAIVVFRINQPQGGSPLNAAFVPAAGTPSAISATCISGVGAAFTYPQATLIVSGTDLWSLNSVSKRANYVQLQGWTIDPGARSTLAAKPADSHSALMVDFVLSGFYAATFNAPAIVMHHGNLTVEAKASGTIAAGDTVELGQGDTVVFSAVAGMMVRNLSSANPLVFTRAFFTEGTASYSVPSGSGFTKTITGETPLPESLAQMLGDGQAVMTLIPASVQTAESTPHAYCGEPNKYQVLTTMDHPSTGPQPSSTFTGMANGYAFWIYPNQG